jgi:septal ring factor EnvC (AmiA/AmiB activator)
MSELKVDMQSLLNYKQDLENVVEEQTLMIEQRNKKFASVEEQLRGKEMQIEQAESAVRRMQQMNDESRKKILAAEVKIK